ncbi:MAG: protein translocase subunit SecD, partial [Acidobacteria bacterium]|nr:protein translocase subunit SecD [Acidobacteriota bacterium]
GFILVVVGFPLYGILRDPQADLRDLFKLGIDLEGGTSLIYELRAASAEAAPPDARQAKRVIMQRIDPQGTRGYTVRPIGKRRLEIVLPGRQTRVRIEQEAVTAENLAAARLAAERQGYKATADLIDANRAALEAGTRLVARMKPPLYLDDIQNRITQAVRERMPKQRPPVAVVGLQSAGEQWESVAVIVGIPPDDNAQVTEWRELVTTALATQQDVTRVKRLVRQAGFLEFRIVADKVKDRDKANFERLTKLKQAGQPPDTTQFRWYPLRKGYGWYKDGLLDAWNFVYVVDEESQTVECLVDVSDGQDVTGQDLSRAGGSTQDGDPIVIFSLKAQAGARFARLTRPEMRDRQMAIILDGTVQSAPSLRATLSTGGLIEGYRNNIRERDEVVTILNSGQLAASLGDPITERTVGPELGADNIRNGFQASIIGFALVVFFILVYYRFAGLVANVALVLNLVLIVCIMFLIRQAWTLPGIAGLILSLAMAVDANVLIYERLREEKGREGSLAFALKKAYERAFRTILDANVTTMIPAFILLLPNLATEEVKGFAVVMITGILVSMFTAVVVTRMIFETALKSGLVKQINMFQLFKAPNIDWMKFVRPAVVVSGALAVGGIILFFSRGEGKYDIEFTGGTQVELAVQPPEGAGEVGIEKVRARVTGAIGAGATVQELIYSHESGPAGIERYLISVPATGDMAAGETVVKEALGKAFKDLRPEAATASVTSAASEITEAVVRERLETRRSVQPATAPAEAAADAAKPAEAPAAQYIPAEERQYLGKVRVRADVTPPVPTDEVRRRIDAFLRDRYPDMVGILYRVDGLAPGAAPGEFKTIDLWVRQDFAGKRADVPNPKFWEDAVKLAMGTGETFASTTSFEPTMAGETWDKAVIAIVFSLAAMAFYIWVRFARFSSGLAAVVALIHDVLITLGAVTLAAMLADTFLGTSLLLSDFKINLPMVGAFLTLVGYSVNDTIVVFDRIRENRGRHGDMSVAIVNASINQTISRTVLTGAAVF